MSEAPALRIVSTLVLVALAACQPDLGPRSAQAHAQDCASCHAGHGEDFAASRHALAGRSPLFEALRERAEAEAGMGPLCDGCHRPASDDGLDCLTCHAAIGTTGAGDGAPILDPSGPVRGATGQAHESAPHDVMESDFLVSGELCGTCHEVSRPAGFEEHLYSDWRDGPSPDTCQDCHMSPEPGVPGVRQEAVIAQGPGLSPRPSAPHDFTGPSSDPVALLSAAFTLEATDGGALLTEVSGGHPAPGGFSAVRWVSLEGRRAGQVVAEEPLSSQLLAGGAEVFDPLEADSVQSRSLSPGEGRALEAPQADEVCLVYQAVRPELSELLGLEPEPRLDVFCVSRSPDAQPQGGG